MRLELSDHGEPVIVCFCEMASIMITKILHYLIAHINSLSAISIRLIGIAVGYLITLLIGQSLGPEALGQYGIITQTGMLLSIACIGGLDLSAIRSFSEARAQALPPATRSLSILFIISFLSLLSVGTGLFFSAEFIVALLIGENAIRQVLLFIFLIALSRAFTRLTSSFLRSQDAHLLSNLIEVLLIPVIVLGFLLSDLLSTLYEVVYATAIASVFVAAFGVSSSFHKTKLKPEHTLVPIVPLLRRAAPLWVVAVSRSFGDWYSLAIVAAFLSLFETGIFRVAMQIASAFPVVMVGIFSVFGVRFGVAHAKQDYREIARLSRSATVLSCVLVIPIGFAITIFAGPILSIVGPEFTRGSYVLQILVIGQVLYVCSGPAGLVLAMTGNEKTNLVIALFSLALLLVSLPIAVSAFGLAGLALSMSIILVLRNLASLLALYKILGINALAGTYTVPESR